MEHVGGDAAPQQLHGHPAAIGGIDAGPPELQDAAREVHDRRDVVLVGRVEAAEPRRGLALDQPVGADDALRAVADRVVHHQQMVRDGVEHVAVALAGGGRGVGLGAHFLVEHPVAQRLHGVDLRGRGGDPHAKIADAQFRKRTVIAADPGDHLLERHRAAPPCSMAGSGSRAAPAIRRERRCRASRLARRLLRFAAPAEQFEPQRDQVEAEPFGHRLHQPLVFGVLELDHLAGIDVDQVIVVAVLGRLVAGAAAAEVAALEDALLLQQAHRAIDRGDRDLRIECAGAAVQLLDVGMIGGLATGRGR